MMKDGLTACVSVTRAVGARASSMLPPTLESSLGTEIDHEISSDQSLPHLWMVWTSLAVVRVVLQGGLQGDWVTPVTRSVTSCSMVWLPNKLKLV